MMLLATSCATSGVPIREFCAVSKPIPMHSADMYSVDTLEGIIAHNEKGQALCGWKAPKHVSST